MIMNNEMIVGRNWIKFTGDESIQNEICTILTYKNDGYKYLKKKWRTDKQKTKCIARKNKDGVLFRAGMLSWVLSRLLYPDTVQLNFTYDIAPESNASLEYLRDYQLKAVNSVKFVGRGLIQVPTGGGKTWIGSGILSAFVGKKKVYLVHRQELIVQVSEVFDKIGLKYSVVGGGTKDSSGPIILAMVQTLSSMIKKDKASWLKDVEVLVIDEVQHAGSPSYESVIDACCCASVKVGLSGTIPSFKNLGGARVLGNLGDVCYSIPPKVLIDAKYVVEPVVTMHGGTWGEPYKEEYKKYNFMDPQAATQYWQDVYELVIVSNVERNTKIAEVCRGKTGVLIIVNTIRHGEILSELMNCPFTHGGSEERFDLFDKFRNSKIPQLIASPIMDEGIDVSGIHTVVIAAGGKSAGRLLQRVGRGMRTEAGKDHVDILDFWDTGVKLLLGHSTERQKTYEEQGYKVTIEMPESLE